MTAEAVSVRGAMAGPCERPVARPERKFANNGIEETTC